MERERERERDRDRERENVHDLQALNKQPVFFCGKNPGDPGSSHQTARS